MKEWYQLLREKRQEYGVSQAKLAVEIGMSRSHLAMVENGTRNASNEMRQLLEEKLETFNPNAQLELMIDYVRIRFPTTNVEFINEKILRIKTEHMLHEDFAFYGYPEKYLLGDIKIMFSRLEVEKGILFELSGQGCRQFESYLYAQGRSWFKFFEDCLKEEATFKRVDLAINDKVGILGVPELSEKCHKEECVSVFRNFRDYKSGELTKQQELKGMGNTLYIGSLKSDIYFCVYEKDYEQFIKNDIPIEDAEVKNRFEIRLKNERADIAIQKLLATQDVESTVFEIINRYVRFVDKEDGKRRTHWKMNANWRRFLGEGRGKMKLTTAPEPYTFERTIKWLKRQVASTLKMVSVLDVVNETEVLTELVDKAVLTERHHKLLEQLLLQVDEVIT